MIKCDAAEAEILVSRAGQAPQTLNPTHPLMTLPTTVNTSFKLQASLC